MGVQLVACDWEIQTPFRSCLEHMMGEGDGLGARQDLMGLSLVL